MHCNSGGKRETRTQSRGETDYISMLSLWHSMGRESWDWDTLFGLCVCACLCVRVRACMHAFLCAWVHVCACLWRLTFPQANPLLEQIGIRSLVLATPTRQGVSCPPFHHLNMEEEDSGISFMSCYIHNASWKGTFRYQILILCYSSILPSS